VYERPNSRRVPLLSLSGPVAPPLTFRQGDVLLLKVDHVPAQAEPEPRGGRIVLAEGEVTGHAHAIEERDARAFTHEGQRYLLTRSRAQLIHEEHAPIEVPPGAYRVIIQREFEPDPIRSVTPSEQWRRVVD
jgi:hypothetical protein